MTRRRRPSWAAFETGTLALAFPCRKLPLGIDFECKSATCRIFEISITITANSSTVVCVVFAYVVHRDWFALERAGFL